MSLNDNTMFVNDVTAVISGLLYTL